MRRVLGAFGGGLILLAAASWPAQAAPPAAVDLVPVKAGHVDLLVPKLVNGALEVSTIVEAEPAVAAGDKDVLLGDADKVQLTGSPALADGDWWASPEVADAAKGPLLGISPADVQTTGTTEVTLNLLADKVEAPAGATFELLNEPPLTAAKANRLLSSDAKENLLTHKLGAVHEDFSWTFSDQGRYRLPFTISVKTASATVTSRPITLTFFVGAGVLANKDLVAATPTTTTVTAAAGATAGQTALTATVAGGKAGSPRGFVEFKDGVDVLGTAPVAVEGGVAKAEFALAEGEHELTAVFSPKYLLDYEKSAESAPVVYTVPDGAGGDPTESPSPTASPTETDDEPADTDCTIITDGDVDYAVRVTGGKAESGVKDGSTLWLDPAEAVIRVPDAAKVALPEGQAFLGDAGEEAWLLPQAAQAGIPSVGWAAEGTAATWKLTEADGPGKAVLFETDGDGTPEVVFDGAGDSRQLTASEHGHATWGFTAPGVYRLTFQHTTASQGSDEGVLTFAVGAYDEADLPSCEVPEDGADSLADTGAPVLLYGCVGVILVTCGAVLLTGVNRRFGLF
ncbi:choice-of-anchor M domain-containing protein [Actinocorallia aurea]